MIPTPLTPSGITAINEPVAFTWSGTTVQAGYILQARLQGTTTWTYDSGLVMSGTRAATVAADTFTAADWEWRVGVVKPTTYPGATTFPGATLWPTFTDAGEATYSESAYFTGRLRPAAPTITAPTPGQTITQARPYIEWVSPSHPAAQHAFQVVRYTLGGVLREDSGQITSTAKTWRARQRTTNVGREYRVRVEHDGLWSPWVSVQVFVFFVGPPTPEPWTVTADEARDCIVVTITNPESAPGQPLLDAQEVWRRVAGDDGDGIRRAVLAGNVTWEDHFVVAGVNYEYRVVALAANGDATETDWQE